MPRAAAENSGRFPIQIRSTEKARLMRAAALERTSLKEFVLRNALSAAESVIQNAERIRLNEEQSRFMLDLLDNPPEPNERLVNAAKSIADRK